ncbi:MAG: TauD/TfdA family dioxygenase [Kiloniellales bacterium]
MTKPSYLDFDDVASGSEIYRPARDEWAWKAADVDPDGCVIPLDARCLDEIAAIVDAMHRHPLPVLLRAPDQFEMPHLSRLIARAKALLDQAPGVAVVDGLPLDDMDEADATALFWILGQLIGRPVAQKWDGTMIYHVRDTGQAYGYGVRGSTTRVELFFHIDNAFGRAPPDHVGVLCLRPAARGGVSRFCSVHSLHQRMLEAHPRLLARLYRPLFWDRQAEHAADAPKVARAPMFACDGRRLKARVNVDLVRKGYQVASQAMDSETEDALTAFRALAADPEFWIELPLERGQLQYLNNRDVAHYRGGFTDHPDPALKRHLIRTWHRDWGQPSYDGVH